MRIDLANAVDWSHPLNRGRGAWWPAIYGGGGRIVDVVGRNHMTAAGTTGNMGWGGNNKPKFPNATPAGTPTVFASAVSALAFLNGASAFTVAAWARPTAINTTNNNFATFFAQVASGAGGSANFPFHLAAVGNGTTCDWIFEVGKSDGSGWASPRTSGGAAIGSVARVVGVFNKADARLYVNGRLAATPAAITVANGSTTTPIKLGSGNANGTNRAFSGSVWDASAWNRALSPSEVYQDYQLSLANYQTRESPLRWLSNTTYFRIPQ